MSKKSVAKHLPKHAPKRTGKAGPRPLDPVTAEAPVKGEPLQSDLPGMEDREIAELEAAAESYAKIRDRRIALNKEEQQLQETLLTVMKANDKTNYVRDGIECKLIHEKEKVRVRIKKDE